MTDRDMLFIGFGFLVLMIGVASFSIQMTVRRNANQRKRVEVQRNQGQATSFAREKASRGQALAEAIKRDPSLANASTPEELARLDELVLSIQKEWRLKSELDALQFAQRAQAEKEEREKAQRVEHQRRKEVEAERQRQQKEDKEKRLAAMKPAMRWVVLHKTISLSVVAVTLIALTSGVVAVVSWQAQSAAEAAKVAAEAAAEAVRAQGIEDARNRLIDNCDYRTEMGDLNALEEGALNAYCGPPKIREDSASISGDENVLAVLASDREPTVRSAVVSNPGASVDILNQLSIDPSPSVRYSVAKNPRTTVMALQKLAQEPGAAVRSAVANNPGASVDILNQLAIDPSMSVRFGVANNPSTSVRTLRKLAKDPISSIKESAQTRLE